MLGITIGTYHTSDDFGLILADTNIGAPEPMRYTVEVAGRNGVVDLTNAISPYQRYRERVITYTFNTLGHVNWQEKMRQVQSAIHGRRLNVIDDSDPSYHWDAFVQVSQQSSQEHLGTIVIIATAYPFKLKNTKTTKSRSGSGTLNCINGRMETSPKVTCTAQCTLTFNGASVTLASGTHYVDFIFTEGNNNVAVTSTGTTTIEYQEGAL